MKFILDAKVVFCGNLQNISGIFFKMKPIKVIAFYKGNFH